MLTLVNLMPWLVVSAWISVAVAYRSAVVRVFQHGMTEPAHFYKLGLFIVALVITYNVGFNSAVRRFHEVDDGILIGRFAGQLLHVVTAGALLWFRWVGRPAKGGE